jgi:hypothetical protein
MKTHILTNTWTQMFMKALSVILPNLETTTDKGINKLWDSHTVKYYSAQ